MLYTSEKNQNGSNRKLCKHHFLTNRLVDACGIWTLGVSPREDEDLRTLGWLKADKRPEDTHPASPNGTYMPHVNC